VERLRRFPDPPRPRGGKNPIIAAGSTVIEASIVVCTHNRGPLLAETVESLLRQRFPSGRFEIIVVDNASTDETAEILAGLARRHPGEVRGVREETLGLSHARNRGLREARGRVIAFTDDDARACDRWLGSLVEACSREGVWCAGGPVRPMPGEALPEWITPPFHPYLALFDHGAQRKELHFDEYPRGVNIAFAREAFESVGTFSPAFGRRGASLLSYEEVELCWRIERLGRRILYVPEAEVFHLVAGERLTPAWFLRRFFWQGKSEAFFDLVHRGRRQVWIRLRGYSLFRRRASTSPASTNGSDLLRRCRRRSHLGYTVGAVEGWLTGVARRSRPIPLEGGASH
jgi:glycosyltransferase involved in cell wall biosynthesis